jgi:cytochrome b involved in lipid metabolism
LNSIQKFVCFVFLSFQIHNYVFDATKFLDDHPGGPEIMVGQAGA